jgi:hypothetical protein
MSYAKVENNKITKHPYSFKQMKDDNPNTSFNDDQNDVQSTEFKRFPVIDKPPTFDPSSQYIEQKPFSDWTFDGTKVTATYDIKQRTIAERKQILVDLLKQKRWEVETGGVNVPINGEEVLVSSARGDDRTNLHVMMTTIVGGMRQDGATFNFADSKPRSVSNADMLTAIGAVLSHVQSAFDKEAEITNEINAANTHAKLDLALDKINEVW